MREETIPTRFGSYQLLNPPPPDDLNDDGVYIYVLQLNVSDEGRAHPFHVGQTRDLKRRFSSHDLIDWHNIKFDRAVKVWLAGRVRVAAALDAEQDLAQRLTAEGYWLAHAGQQNRDTASTASPRDILKRGRDEILAYALQARGTQTALKAWRKQWLTPASIPEPVATPKTVAIPRENLIRVLETMREQMRGRGRDSWRFYQLWQTIASTYDEVSGQARLHLSAADVQFITSPTAAGRLQQVWWPQRKIKPGINTFILRKSFQAEYPQRLKIVQQAAAIQLTRARTRGHHIEADIDGPATTDEAVQS